MKFTTSDGLKLAYEDEGEGTVLLCLPGLTRNARDFDDLADSISAVRIVRLTRLKVALLTGQIQDVADLLERQVQRPASQPGDQLAGRLGAPRRRKKCVVDGKTHAGTPYIWG